MHSAAEVVRTAQGVTVHSGHSDQRPQQQFNSTQPAVTDTRLSWQGRHQACAGRISVTSTRPTAAAATAPGRETSCPRRCTRRPPGKLVFLKDQLSGALFLANTGATVSIIPGPTSSGGQALTSAKRQTAALLPLVRSRLSNWSSATAIPVLTTLVLISSRVKLTALSWASILCASSR